MLVLGGLRSDCLLTHLEEPRKKEKPREMSKYCLHCKKKIYTFSYLFHDYFGGFKFLFDSPFLHFLTIFVASKVPD